MRMACRAARHISTAGAPELTGGTRDRTCFGVALEARLVSYGKVNGAPTLARLNPCARPPPAHHLPHSLPLSPHPYRPLPIHTGDANQTHFNAAPATPVSRAANRRHPPSFLVSCPAPHNPPHNPNHGSLRPARPCLPPVPVNPSRVGPNKSSPFHRRVEEKRETSACLRGLPSRLGHECLGAAGTIGQTPSNHDWTVRRCRYSKNVWNDTSSVWMISPPPPPCIWLWVEEGFTFDSKKRACEPC